MMSFTDYGVVFGSDQSIIFFFEKQSFLGMVLHICNPSTCEAEAGGLKVQSQYGVHSETLSQNM
jgi:hypothetical protein